jgi:hypothetical protein
MRYDRAYYEAQETGSFIAARAILPLLFAHSMPSSVVDVGCGTGCWLKAARMLGVPTILGFDRPDLAHDQLAIPAARFRAIDLACEAPAAPHRFDLALCLETAAQLPRQRARSFVRDLTLLSDVILFSSPIPHQGGPNHVNEQLASYWITHFGDAGFQCFDFLRPRIWGFTDLPVPYRQNLLVFARDREFPNRVSSPAAADLIHPALWAERNGPGGVLRTARRALPPTMQYRLTSLRQRIDHVQVFRVTAADDRKG